MRTLFYEFPDDPQAWEFGDQFLLGSELLVAPILNLGHRTREVYLPNGASWKELYTGLVYRGGSAVIAEAPLDTIPLFLREGAKVLSTIQFSS
jgi:alpha-D-xyloside xylohydrolase